MARRAKDWHSADVRAALSKAGFTLRQVGKLAKYADPDSARHVLKIPMPRAEAVIAAILRLPASRIWPSRYSDDGLPRGWRGRRWMMSVETDESNTPARRVA